MTTRSLIELIERIIGQYFLVFTLINPEVNYFRHVELELRILAIDPCAALIYVLRIQKLRHVEIVMLQYLIEAILRSQSNSWPGQQLSYEILRKRAFDGFGLLLGQPFLHVLVIGCLP